jgi:hypothetical protein
MDVENLDAGQEFNELPDTYTIFITEKDFFGKAEPFYLFRWTEVQSKEFLNDGAYILYVNGEYRGDDELGRLMHDFNCTNATDMNYNIMAERTRYLKENQEGVTEMCKAMEEMKNEAAIVAEKKVTFSHIVSLMSSMKWTIEQALANMNVPSEDWDIYKAMMMKKV